MNSHASASSQAKLQRGTQSLCKGESSRTVGIVPVLVRVDTRRKYSASHVLFSLLMQFASRGCAFLIRYGAAKISPF